MSNIPTKSRVSRGGNKRKPPKDKTTTASHTGGYKDAGLQQGQDHEDFDESQHCLICTEKIVYASYSACQHKTCHKCCLRQRALYKRNLCLVCRTANEDVIISPDIDKDYNQFSPQNLPIFNDEFKIYFTDEQVCKDTLELLELKCSFKACGIHFDNFKDLQDHIKQDHNRYFCLLCYNNKKAFISELALYHYKSLQNHQTIGDEKGFKGHPACKHCVKKRFYSEDELNIHIRDSHERCHICDQDNPKMADYYKNYDELFEHFRVDHYVCMVQSCLDKKFVVFREDLDLTAHMLKEHGSLTGANNKIVFGAGRAYQSQLSTYQQPNGNRAGRNGNNTEEADSINVKRMRLEERAKHYLQYDNKKMDEFSQINSSFRSGSIQADELADVYKQLFKDRTTEEILIVMTEFAELFPESGVKFKSLQDTIKKIEKSSSTIEFPILGGRAQSPIVDLHGWGGSPSPNNSKNSSVDSFPALQKPQKTKKQAFNVKQQPIRYSTITKSQPKTPTAVNIHSFTNDTSYRPNYLERSTSSSPSLSSPSLSPATATASGSGGSSSDLKKFPMLEKKTTKKTFPRVNPVNIPSSLQWGSLLQQQQQQQLSSQRSQLEEDFGIPIIDKRKQKQKKQSSK